MNYLIIEKRIWFKKYRVMCREMTDFIYSPYTPDNLEKVTIANPIPATEFAKASNEIDGLYIKSIFGYGNLVLVR